VANDDLRIQHFYFDVRKDSVQGVNRRGGTEVEFFCSKECGYHMRYHCKRVTYSPGQQEDWTEEKKKKKSCYGSGARRVILKKKCHPVRRFICEGCGNRH
jgi:hypothetical protein